MPPLTLAEWVRIDVVDRLLTVEWELARKLLEAETWVATGGGSYYLSHPEGEVHIVHANGVEYLEKFSVAGVDAVWSSYFYDIDNKRLYIHMVDNDSPSILSGANYKYCIMAFFWVGFANMPKDLQRYDNVIKNGKLDVWTSATVLESWDKQSAGTAALGRESTEVYDALSAYSAKLSVGAAASWIKIYKNLGVVAGSGDLALRPGKKATIRFKYKCADGSSILKIKFHDYLNNVWLDSSGSWAAIDTTINLPNSTAWTEYKLEFNAHIDYFAYTLEFIVDTDGHICRVDYVEVRRYREEVQFHYFLPENAIPSISHSVGSFHDLSEELSFGAVGFNDDGWFSERFHKFHWNNKNFHVKFGLKTATYDDLSPMFSGISRTPNLEPGKFRVDVKDARAELIKVPVTRFDSTNYPNCEENWENKPIPILLGYQGFVPPCCDITTFTYKPSQTTFGLKTYGIYQILKVFKADVELTLGVDYTVDLPNGTFTLTEDPGDAVITCQAKGLNIEMEGGGYGYFACDYLLFLLHDLNGIPKDKINYRSLLEIKDKRKIELAKWISEEIESKDILEILKKSAVFHLLIRADGEYFARVLESTVPSDASHFYDYDYKNWNYSEDTEHCYKKIVVKYRQHYLTGDFKEEEEICDRAEWEHGIKKAFDPETWVLWQFQATDLKKNYSAILKSPLGILRVTLPHQALLLNPMDKIYISKTIINNEGDIVTFFDEQVFIILSITKNLQTAQAEIMAIKNIPELYWTIT